MILLFATANARDLPLPYLDAAPLPQSGGSKLVALVGGTILPMDGDRAIVGNVLFLGDTLIAVGDVPVPRGASVIDVRGRWLMPGLIDAHVHVFDERELPLFLTAGVTSIVNMSGSTLTLAWNASDPGDHVRILTAVPEPQTYALMLAGLGMTAWFARRRRPG